MEIVSTGQEADPAATVLTSEIVKCGDEAQVEASAQLLGHLGQMLNDPAFSDVELVCNDGKRVLASRMLLAGRSDVLKSMFMNGMAESSLSEIALPEISSPVLLSVLEFLYTGTLSKHSPQSWRMACEVIIASRFFLLPNLEKITRKFMHTLSSGIAQNLQKIASLLTMSVEFTALCDETDVNLKELVTILSSNWSDSAVFVHSLSEEAFHYLLENSKGTCDENDNLSFTEYLRFRQVIRWCVYKSDGDTVEELLNFLAPNEQQALSLCNAGNLHDVESLPKDSTLPSDSPFHEHEDITNSAIRLLSNIDCRKIHPILLAKVVEPLNLISAGAILNSFRFHAVLRPMIFRRPECGWELGESYSTLEQGFVIHKNRIGVGLAVSKAAMSRSYGVYQWRFIVEQYSETFCELGFIYYSSAAGIEKPELQGERLSDQHRARVLNFQGTQAMVNWKGATGRVGWEVLSNSHPHKTTALFTLNASERTCSLSFHGQDVGVVWDNLPRAVYYPAVCLGTSSAGRVRIELVGGLDIL